MQIVQQIIFTLAAIFAIFLFSTKIFLARSVRCRMDQDAVLNQERQNAIANRDFFASMTFASQFFDPRSGLSGP